MKLWIWSDQHFLHKNIIQYQHRPFEPSFRGMIDNAKLMYNNYKALVSKDDVCLFLGDVALIKDSIKPYLIQMFQELPGTKILIKGNHDTRKNDFYKLLGFQDVKDYLIVGKFFLCHYPYCSMPPKLKETFDLSGCQEIIHGHVHNNDIISEIKHCNVCVERTDYKPLEFTDKVLVRYFKRYASIICG